MEADATRDFFSLQQSAGGPRKRRKKPEPAEGAEEDVFFAREAGSGRLPKYVELLKFKSLGEGARVWGTVAEVGARGLVVSLPHGLRGHVAPAEASDVMAELVAKADAAAAAAAVAPAASAAAARRAAAAAAAAVPKLAELFSVGQLVRCTVVGKEGATEGGDEEAPRRGRRIVLSLHVAKAAAGMGAEALAPGRVLPACVRSIEDHGFTLSLGVPGARAFLERSNYAKAFGADVPAPRPGSLLEVVVTAARDRRMVHVSADPKAVTAAVAREWDGLTLGALMPGMLVNAKVRHVLSDGLLVSFLTFFNGTIDCFHLHQSALAGDRQVAFSEGQKLRARTLFVDPASKRVGLSLLPHLVAVDARLPSLPPVGTVYKNAIVRRVDPALGLLLELPPQGLGDSEADPDPEPDPDPAAPLPPPREKGDKRRGGRKKAARAAKRAAAAAAAGGGVTGSGASSAPVAAGYAHISNVADTKIDKLDKAFKVGQVVRARVVGTRPMDALAVLSLRPSVVESGVASYADVRIGALMKGTIASVEDYGVFVTLTPSIKALVLQEHLTDLGTAAGRARLRVGQAVAGRVLQADAPARRIMLTLKKALVGAKLPPFTAWEEALPGARAHGYVTGVQDYGVFVGFCGDLRGLAPVAELGLPAGQRPSQGFKVGQVVKATVLTADPEARRLRLSLVPGAAAPRAGDAGAGAAGADPMGGLQPGDVVEGVVRSVTTAQEGEGEEAEALVTEALVEVRCASGAMVMGRLDAAHLADHPSAVSALRACVAAGADLGPLLVLERLERVGMVRLSRKASLLAAAAALPRELGDVAEGRIVPGYVASVVQDAVFVRFLNGLTGRAGLAQLADTFVSDPRRHFAEGQSVRAAIAAVDSAKGRFALSLKPSLVANPDGAYLGSLFCDFECAERVRASLELAEGGLAVDWAALPLGGLVGGTVHDVRDYGVLCDLEGHPDIVALVSPGQAEGSTVPGTAVRGRVLDVNKKDGIVDLSLLARLAAAKKGKAAKATAEFAVGARVPACVELAKDDYAVVSLPQHGAALGYAATADFNSAAPDARPRFSAGQALTAVVAALPGPATGGRLLLHVPTAPSAAAEVQRAKKQPRAAPGRAVDAVVTSVFPLFVVATLSNGARGRLHVSEVEDGEPGEGSQNPLERFPAGAALRAVVLEQAGSRAARQHGLLELSTRPSLLTAAVAGAKTTVPRLQRDALEAGQVLAGWVADVEASAIWVALSPTLRGRVHALDASDELAVLRDLPIHFPVGKPLRCRILKVVKGKRLTIDLSLRGVDAGAGPAAGAAPAPGDLVCGLVTDVSGRGVTVQLAQRAYGRATLANLHDTLVPDALAGLQPGAFVRCRVLSPAASPSGDGVAACAAAQPKPTAAVAADGGEDGRALRVSLRASHGGEWQGRDSDPGGDPAPETISVGALRINQPVAGYISAVNASGAFLNLACDLTARVRLSNLADGFVQDPAATFPVGQLARGTVLSVDGNRVEVTLRSKGGAGARLALQDLEVGQVVRGRVKRVERYGVFVEVAGGTLTGLVHISEAADEYVKDLGQLFSPGQSVRARVLAVDLEAQRLSLGLKASYLEGAEDVEDDEAGAPDAMDLDTEAAEAGGVGDADADDVSEDSGGADHAAAPVDAGDLDAEAEEEARLRAAELRQLQAPAPQSAADFEKLVMGSPNSSYVWIQFMAHLVSVGQLDAARAVAERALATINFREEGEKFNVWVAWLNLENLYGQPPGEAVMALFRRALPHVNQKRLYLALLAILQRTDKDELAAEALRAMCRKFGASAKVWLRAVDHALRRGEGETARRTLERALAALPPRKHIKVLSATAVAEFKVGSAERGRAIFEDVLRNYPKRTDLWSVYLDQEFGQGDQERTRALFERATHLALPPKKMKFLFRRYLDYEKAHGDAAVVERVRAAARAYVESNLAA
ncbi:hypothetical protein WJX81_004603 [Elliptochloris bilobata]|uniref:S1 motif domain-containing protein n=1 Tax=Elliptochloris bilobata TaxID=381761 RepID=A0AAW1REW8_9CHLO